MSNRSQLNNMSKREILESIMHQQNQDVANLNRLVIALAKTLGADPKQFAENFVSMEDNQKYAMEFNAALQEAFKAQQQKPATEKAE